MPCQGCLEAARYKNGHCHCGYCGAPLAKLSNVRKHWGFGKKNKCTCPYLVEKMEGLKAEISTTTEERLPMSDANERKRRRSTATNRDTHIQAWKTIGDGSVTEWVPDGSQGLNACCPGT